MILEQTHSDKRDLSFDYMKGILIFLVVWGHLIEFSLIDRSTIYFDTLRKIIYAFHMPLFVFISGWFFKSNENFFLTAKKQFARLLVPQFSFVFLGLLIFFIFWDIYSYKLIEDGFPSIKKIYHFAAFAWYLWCIFFCSLIVVACNFFFHKKSKYALIAICILMWLLVDNLPNPFFNRQQVARMLPCFCLGMLAKNNITFLFKYRKQLIITSILVCIPYFILFILNPQKELPGYIIRIPLQLFPTCLVFFVIKYLFSLGILKNFFLQWSRDTLFIYICHGFILELLNPFNFYLSFGPNYINYLFWGIISLITCFILGSISKFLRNYSWTKKVFLGEK